MVTRLRKVKCSEMQNKDERFFVVLLVLALTGLAVLAAGIWYLQFVGVTQIARVILVGIAVLLSLVFLVFGIGFGSVVLTLMLERPLLFLLRPTRLAVEYLFPLAMYFGQFLGFPKTGLQRAFINVSNHLVGIHGVRVKGNEIMILLPHCIQKSDCRYRVTTDVENCRRCGRCTLSELLKLKEKYGCHIVVATGGTLARKFVKELRPRAIVAVACERDLASGIQDTYPMPVTGILNIRPEGPCVNTLVDVKEVERAILQFIGGSED